MRLIVNMEYPDGTVNLDYFFSSVRVCFVLVVSICNCLFAITVLLLLIQSSNYLTFSYIKL